MSSSQSESESDVGSQEELPQEEAVEPMLNEMEARKKKRLDQLAAARKKSLAVRKEKHEPKKKRIELQAQVNKQLYDAEVARVAELKKILDISEKRNSEQEAKLKRAAKTLQKHCAKPTQRKVARPQVEIIKSEDEEQSPEDARLEHLMRQLYSG